MTSKTYRCGGVVSECEVETNSKNSRGPVQKKRSQIGPPGADNFDGQLALLVSNFKHHLNMGQREGKEELSTKLYNKALIQE